MSDYDILERDLHIADGKIVELQERIIDLEDESQILKGQLRECRKIKDRWKSSALKRLELLRKYRNFREDE